MTTATATYETRGSPFPVKLLLLAVLVLGLVFAVSYKVSHAVAKHGTDAYVVRSYCHGQQQFWYNPNSKHVARWCELPDDTHVGIQILRWCGDKWDEVTAFAKNIDRPTAKIAAESYLKRTGYQPIEPGVLEVLP